MISIVNFLVRSMPLYLCQAFAFVVVCFVIMFHSSGTPAEPGKKSCQMPFFSTSC